MARAAIIFSGRARERSGPKAVDNVRRAMKQNPREYWAKEEKERNRLARLIRREIAKIESQQAVERSQRRIADQRASAVEAQLQIKQRDEREFMEELLARQKKKALMAGADDLLAEQEDLEDWRANNRP